MSITISETNKHIEDYLDYYCEDKINDYAVLIKGSWGAGKTWFIREYEQKLNKNGFKRVIYISLNGVSKKDAIDDMIFCALHPILTNPATKFIGKVAAGLVKASTKLDLNNDGKKDEVLSISLPNVDVNSVLKKGEKLILIFDDLERCLMPIPETLGYINYFVEHTNSKAIILANEEQIKKNEKSSKVYLNEKEKLVGTSFEFHGDVRSALNHFINDLPRGGAKVKLQSETVKDNIIEIYKNSKLNNIRSIRQSLREFVRFYSEEFFKKDDELFSIILEIFLSISLEYRNNGFDGKILNFKSSENIEDKNIKKLKHRSEFTEKYKLSKHRNLILSDDVWHSILVDNIVNNKIIKQELHVNYFKYKEKNPPWYEINRYNEIENNENFNNLLDIIVANVEKLECEELGEVLHIVAAVLFFNNKKLIKKDIDIEDFIKKSLECVEKIYFKYGKNYLDRNYYSPRNSWGGLYYLGYDSEYFKDYFNRFLDCLDLIEKKEFNKRVKCMYLKIESNNSDLIEDLLLWKENTKQTEILQIELIDAKIMVDFILKLNTKDLDYLFAFFRERRLFLHNEIGIDNLLAKWMEDIIKFLKEKNESLEQIEKLNFYEQYVHRVQNIHDNALTWQENKMQ